MNKWKRQFSPKPLLPEGKTISLHLQQRQVSSSSFLIWSWGTALLSASYLQAGRFLTIPKQGEIFGKSVALRAMACTTTRLCCPDQGTRNACSAVHPSADPHPVSHSCTWAGWQQERQLLCSMERMPLSKYQLPRSIWKIIQLMSYLGI